MRPANFDGGPLLALPAAMRARAAGVNPNSVAYLTMSLAALFAVWTSGFCIALPLVVLIIKPLVSKSRSAIFASDASAVRQRPYA
jgi:hypothetical protein